MNYKLFKSNRVLSIYKKTGYMAQQKARFAYYLSITMILTTFFVLIKTGYKQISENGIDHLNLPMLLPIIIGILIYLFSLFLLIRGYYNLSINIILIMAISIVWLSLMLSEEKSISRIDGIAYVFVVLSMVPLMIKKGKYLPYLYSLISIFFLIFFVLTNQKEIGLYGKKLSDYIIDTSLSFLLIGFIGHQIFAINKLALEKAEKDITERKEAQAALIKSERKYREMTDLLPQIVAEVDLKGNVTYLNQAGYEKFGISKEDFKQGINVFSVLFEKEAIATNLKKILDGSRISGNIYTARRKNGEAFPVQIFSSVINENNKAIGIRGVLIDISDRVKAEEDLRASEKKFREMTLLLPQTVYESDLNGQLTYVNQAGFDEFGYTEEDFYENVNVMTCVAEEDHEQLRENILKILEGKMTHGNEYTGKRKDGSTFPVQIYSSVIMKDNKPVGFRGVILNITDRVLAEEKTRQSNELFKTLIESFPISICLTDKENRFILVNQTFCNDLDLTPEMVIGKTADDIGLKSDEAIENIIRKELSKNGHVYNIELSVLDKNNKRHDLYVSAQYIEINNQKLLLRSNINVTDKKKLENKLKESETLFKLIVDIVPYSIIIYNYDQHYTFVNRSFLEKYNFRFQDVIGKTPSDLGFKMNPDTIKKFNTIYNSEEKVLNMEISFQSPAKENSYSLLSAQTAIIDDKPHIITTDVDITDRKILEKQISEYNERLEQLVKERTEELAVAMKDLNNTNEELQATNEELFAQRENLEATLETLKETQEHLIHQEKMASLGILTAGVAHEINNPINYIYNGTIAIEGYIKDNMPDHYENLKPLIDAINTGIKRTTNIVTSLNKYNRQDDSSFSDCNVNEIIDNCLTILFNQYKNRIEIVKEYNTELPSIFANEGKLHQVFLNILTNAIQAIEDKGKINIKTNILNNQLEIVISDTGKGINESDMKHIYDPFFTTKDPGKGTGLGLSITQKIIQEHKGTIKCKSKPGEGTEFFINLPS